MAGRAPGAADEGAEVAEAVAGDSDDGVTAVGDDAAPGVAGGDGDDVTVVGDGAVAGTKAAGAGKGGVPGSGAGHDKVLAWLTGQSHDADSYKAALLDPDSRFPAVVTANPVMVPAGVPLPTGELDTVEALVGGWLSGEKSIAGWTLSDWRAVAEARGAGYAAVATAVLRVVQAHNPHTFDRYRAALDAVNAIGDPVVAAGRLLRADDDLLRHRGIDVFALEWRALSVDDQAVTESLVSRQPGSVSTARWSDRDWGAVDRARRLGQARGFGEAVAEAVIKKVVTGQDPLVGLRAALYDASTGDAVTRLNRADAALRAMGVDDAEIYRLAWTDWLDEQPAIEAFARRLAGWSTYEWDGLEWDGLEWDAVAAAHRASEALAAAVIMGLVTARNSDAFNQYRSKLAAAHASETPAAAARILMEVAEDPMEFEGIGFFALEWAALPASQKAVLRTLVSRWIGPRSTVYWTDGDWGVVAVARGFGEAVTAAVIKKVATHRNSTALASYNRVLTAASLKSRTGDIAWAVTSVMLAAYDLLRHSDIDVSSLEWAALSASEQAATQALVRDSMPESLFTRPTAGWTAHEWGAVALAHAHIGQQAVPVAAWRVAADHAGLPVRNISSLREETNRQLDNLGWPKDNRVNDATVAQHYATLTKAEAGSWERSAAFAIAGRITEHGKRLGFPGGGSADAAVPQVAMSQQRSQAVRTVVNRPMAESSDAPRPSSGIAAAGSGGPGGSHAPHVPGAARGAGTDDGVRGTVVAAVGPEGSGVGPAVRGVDTTNSAQPPASGTGAGAGAGVARVGDHPVPVPDVGPAGLAGFRAVPQMISKRPRAWWAAVTAGWFTR
ncbi:hypothetical protein PV350_45640 [Streptomyces sp. PA03-6a]|nr:hypothetical protein [Streptomyces sp. PA03-6a]